jgi:hypothetical protein
MLRLLADENLDNRIIRALVRGSSSLDLVRVQDVGLSGADDPTVLEYAAGEGRIVLTHDIATMAHFAYERVRAGLSMPGMVEVPVGLSVRIAADDIRLLAECSEAGEWEGQVLFLPLS